MVAKESSSFLRDHLDFLIKVLTMLLLQRASLDPYTKNYDALMLIYFEIPRSYKGGQEEVDFLKRRNALRMGIIKLTMGATILLGELGVRLF